MTAQKTVLSQSGGARSVQLSRGFTAAPDKEMREFRSTTEIKKSEERLSAIFLTKCCE